MRARKLAPPTSRDVEAPTGDVSIEDRKRAIRKSVPHGKQARQIVGRDRLTWQRDPGGFALRYGRQVLLHVVSDADWPGMFRIRFAEGGISDFANLPRARDAAVAAALRHLNLEVQETALEAPPARRKGRGHVGAPNEDDAP